MDKRFRIAIGNDHRGFFVKEKVRAYLIDSGHDVLDVGAYDCNSSDFPDYAAKVVTEINICGLKSAVFLQKCSFTILNGLKAVVLNYISCNKKT